MAHRAEIRTPLPTDGRVHRVGKIRAGIKKQGTKDGNPIEYPSAVDYFVVHADASTSEQSAASFHEVYGNEPRELRITLPGIEPEDVLESAWRMYGGSVLKRKCEGPGGECKERGSEGEWIYGPCACTREGLDVEDKRHCQPRWTLSFLLMNVVGMGVWQFDTGSPMAGDGMAAMLKLLYSFRGSLLRAECVLRLVPVQVAPKGRPKTVYIARLEAAAMTPAQAMELAGDQTPLGVLPPSTLDEGPDDLLDAGVVETPPEPTPVMTIAEQLRAFSLHERADLYRLLQIESGVKASVVRVALVKAWEELGYPPFVQEPSARMVLNGLRSKEMADLPPDSAEAFQAEIDSGQTIEPGDQISMYGEGAPS